MEVRGDQQHRGYRIYWAWLVARVARIALVALLCSGQATGHNSLSAQTDCGKAQNSAPKVETKQQEARRQAVEKRRNERRDRHWDVQSKKTRKRMRRNNRFARRQALGKPGKPWIQRVFRSQNTPWHIRLRSRLKQRFSPRQKRGY